MTPRHASYRSGEACCELLYHPVSYYIGEREIPRDIIGITCHGRSPVLVCEDVPRWFPVQWHHASGCCCCCCWISANVLTSSPASTRAFICRQSNSFLCDCCVMFHATPTTSNAADLQQHSALHLHALLITYSDERDIFIWFKRKRNYYIHYIQGESKK